MSGTCFFIGHREAGEEVLPALTQAVERQIIQYGVTDFMAGHYGGFDRMAALTVQRAKEKHPGVTLTLLLPYHPFDRPIQMPEGFDGTYYPPGMERVPKRLAIVRANRYLVDHSDCLIAYAWHPASNARELLEYARRREQRGLLRVENLADFVRIPTVPSETVAFPPVLW